MGVTLVIFNLVGNMPDFIDWFTIIVIAFEISLLISLSNSELRTSWPELRDDFNSCIIFLVIIRNYLTHFDSNNLCNFGHGDEPRSDWPPSWR